ncbi:MAG TPA: response regulator [Vicinamibacteria bacterium]|nr:response regulator [Vicinamibacteria bacterium]
MSAGTRKLILVVDDTETVLIFTKMMLAGQAAEVVVARNGREALKRVEEQAPDLILMDIMMPEMDGVETCRRLKADPRTGGIPVVMVTTKGNPEKVEEAFAAGCDDYLTKPFGKLDLMAKIRRYMH